MPNEENFNIEKGMATGSWIQRLVEDAEIKAIHTDIIWTRLRETETRMEAAETIISSLISRVEALEGV